MKKRLAVITATVMAMAALAGCGGGSQETAAEAGNTSADDGAKAEVWTE